MIMARSRAAIQRNDMDFLCVKFTVYHVAHSGAFMAAVRAYAGAVSHLNIENITLSHFGPCRYLFYRGPSSRAKPRALWVRSTCRTRRGGCEAAPLLAALHRSFTFSFGRHRRPRGAGSAAGASGADGGVMHLPRLQPLKRKQRKWKNLLSCSRLNG